MGSVSVPESVQSVIQSGSLETKSDQEVVRWALETFGNKVALASSFSAEDVAIIHMMVQVNPKARVFTLDTGRLNQETYDVMDKIREKCRIPFSMSCANAASWCRGCRTTLPTRRPRWRNGHDASANSRRGALARSRCSPTSKRRGSAVPRA